MLQLVSPDVATDAERVLEQCSGEVFDQDVGPLFGQLDALLHAASDAAKRPPRITEPATTARA